MNTPPQSPPTITTRELADKAMQANRAARLAASERGAPETEMSILMDSATPPEINGYELSRMTAGIAELMRRRRFVEAEITPEELIYMFWGSRACWEIFKDLTAPAPAMPEKWHSRVFDLSLMLDREKLEQCSAWVTRELHDFFGLPEASPPEEPSQQEPDVKAAEPDGGCEPSMESSPPTEEPGPPVQILCDGPCGSSPSTSTSL